MAELTVMDVRADYYHPGQKTTQVVEHPGWNPFQAPGLGAHLVQSGPGLVGGLLVQAGANSVTVEIYDGASQTSLAKRVFRFVVPSGAFDGWVDFPIRTSSGIVLVVQSASDDHAVFVYYR